MNIDNIDGNSRRGRISLISDKYISTCICDSKGNMKCTTTAISEKKSKALENNFCLKSLRLLAFIIAIMSWKEKAVFIGVAAFLFVLPQHGSTSPTTQNISALVSLLIYAGGAILLFCAFLDAPWHGAEHMVIACYERNKRLVEVSEIEAESRISAKCGSRFFFPIFIGAFTSAYFSKKYGIKPIWLFAIALECILQIDYWIGWNKIPIAAQASYLLQKYFTTRKPGGTELQTAQKALSGLLEVHK